MELSVASPLWAWAFTTLIVPILIHFFVSRWQPPRQFAAMRFLQSSAEQGKARRISDWWLLLLRLLLLSCLILALMGLQLLWPVMRSERLVVVHPSVPASAITAETWYWLCAPVPADKQAWFAATQPSYVLQEATRACADKGEHFVPQLLDLLTQRAELAVVSVQVPAQLRVPLLSWPDVPVQLNWQTHPSAEAVATRQWTVAAPAALQALLPIANELSVPALWRVTDNHEQAQLIIGTASKTAAVSWHNEPLPWQYMERDGARYGFHVDGQQLHLQLEQIDSLQQDGQRLSQLLAISDAWLARGQLIWSQPVQQLSDAITAATTETAAADADVTMSNALSAKKNYPLRDVLLLLVILLLLLERGVVHGRR